MSRKFFFKNIVFISKLSFLIIYSSVFWISIYKAKEVNFNKKESRISKDILSNYSFYQDFSNNLLVNLKWEKLIKPSTSNKKIKWEIFNSENFNNFEITNYKKTEKKLEEKASLNSLNRSIVFNNKVIGPDISWLVPPGLQWSKAYKWDFSTRGHNRRRKGEKFLGWHGGDAVGQFYYHPISFKDYSFGFNLGMRSVYQGSAIGGSTNIGEGLSMGFRLDKALSENSGFAFGAEQLLAFDGVSDTGRDIYLTVSKGWWSENLDGNFPLTVGTFGIATGKMAEGNIKGLCTDLLGGSGTEAKAQRPLCWAPVFSISRVFNDKLSSYH